MDKEMMYWRDVGLFKVGLKQLINKLSFMGKWSFALAASRIENQSCEKAFKQSLPKCSFIRPGCEMLVDLTNITRITANPDKFISNLWTENTWTRILVRKCLTQFIIGDN